MWNFVFFARRQITGACLFIYFFFSFPQGSSYQPSGPRMSHLLFNIFNQAQEGRLRKEQTDLRISGSIRIRTKVRFELSSVRIVDFTGAALAATHISSS